MNKKNFKVIKLNGMSGLVLVVLFVLGVVGSFVVLPVYGVKFLWNYFLGGYFDLQQIRLAQAALLWFAAISVLYAYLRSKVQFKFVNQASLTEDNLNQIDYDKFIEKIKKEQQNDEKINH